MNVLRATKPTASMRVFTISGVEASGSENLMLDIILGMDWLFSNHILIDHARKTLIFQNLKDTRFITANQANAALKEEA
ncbi:hypothetical protein CR513_31998, partial [Mucuna pruriens]